MTNIQKKYSHKILLLRTMSERAIPAFVFFALSLIILSCNPNNHHPGLLFKNSDLPALRKNAESEEGKAILRQLRDRLNEPAEALFIGSYASGYAFLYQLSGDIRYADSSRYFTELTFRDSLLFESSRETGEGKGIPLWNSDYKEIYRAPNLIGIALAYDMCYNAWDKQFCKKVAAELAEKGAAVIDGGGKGYNDKAWSNWQGTTKGAGGLAMLAIEKDGVQNIDVPGYLQKASDGMNAHLQWLSTKGWTPEGFNYLRYELCSGVLPFLQVWEHVKGEKIFADKAKWFLPFFTMKSIVRDKKLYIPMYGLGNPWWNTDRWRSGDWVMGMGITPPEFLPSVKWTFDKSFGLEGDSTFNIFKPYDAIFALLNYPFNIETENPGKILEHMWVDSVGGYYIFRNRWKDADDFVITLSSNILAKPASHSFRDAGSFRISGLGADWAVRPEKSQLMEGKNYENHVLVKGATNWPGAKTIYCKSFPEGSGSLVFDMTKSYYGGEHYRDTVNLGIESSRSFAVDYSMKSGVAAVVVVADKFKNGGTKTWQMHTGAGRIEIKKNEFYLRQSDEIFLKGTFLFPPVPEIKFDYLTNTISATSANHFLVVMTIQKGVAPSVWWKSGGFPSSFSVGEQTFAIENNRIQF